jgi:hypothetical protein
MDHFGRLHEQNPENETVLYSAALIALFCNDAQILDYLLSRGCPWYPENACKRFTSLNVPTSREAWARWRGTFEIVLKYSPPGSSFRNFLCDWATEVHDVDFVLKAVEIGNAAQ